jgi:hypothetical protein
MVPHNVMIEIFATSTHDCRLWRKKQIPKKELELKAKVEKVTWGLPP